jgi:hypothetical protein
MSLKFPQNEGNFLTSWENIGFLWRTVLLEFQGIWNVCYNVQLQSVTLKTGPLARRMLAGFKCNSLYLCCTAVICFSFTWDCHCSLWGTNLGFIYYLTDSQAWYNQLLHSWVNRIWTFFKQDLWYFQVTYWSRYSVMATTTPPPPPSFPRKQNCQRTAGVCTVSW